MGDDIQSIIARRFKHYSNRAHEKRLNTPDLFTSSPTILIRPLRCRIADPANAPTQGQTVALVKNGHSVQLWSEERVIGAVVNDDSEDVLSALGSEHRAGGIILARVEDEAGIDNCCSVIVTEGGGDGR